MIEYYSRSVYKALVHLFPDIGIDANKFYRRVISSPLNFALIIPLSSALFFMQPPPPPSPFGL